MAHFEKRSTYPVPAQRLYDWHSREGAFERLSPPWDDVRTVHAEGGITDGAIRVMKLRKGPLSLTWEAHHSDHIEGEQFVDLQVKGPFKSWVHTHRFESRGPEKCELIDSIEYKLPLGPLGSLVGGPIARGTLDDMFRFRHLRTGDDLLRHKEFPALTFGYYVGMKSFFTTDFEAFFSTGGHKIYSLFRSEEAKDDLPLVILYPEREDRSFLKTLGPKVRLILIQPGATKTQEQELRSLCKEAVIVRHAPFLDPRVGVLHDLQKPLRRFKLSGEFSWVDPDDLLGFILQIVAEEPPAQELYFEAPQKAESTHIRDAFRHRTSDPTLEPMHTEAQFKGLKFHYFFPTFERTMAMKLPS